MPVYKFDVHIDPMLVFRIPNKYKEWQNAEKSKADFKVLLRGEKAMEQKNIYYFDFDDYFWLLTKSA